MGATRCDHGRIVEEWGNHYRCFKCEPVASDDIDGLKDAIDELEGRIRALERLEPVIRELADRAGLDVPPWA